MDACATYIMSTDSCTHTQTRQRQSVEGSSTDRLVASGGFVCRVFWCFVDVTIGLYVHSHIILEKQSLAPVLRQGMLLGLIVTNFDCL